MNRLRLSRVPGFLMEKPRPDRILSVPADSTRRFLLEDLDIRGQLVCLTRVWQAVAGRRAYTEAERNLLGEFAAVAVLVGFGLKHRGRAVLQVTGGQVIKMLVVDCTDDLKVRGYLKTCEANDHPRVARPRALESGGGDPIPLDAPLARILSDTRLALTIENRATGQMYQSIVPVEGATVAEVFEQYLDQSEQAPTHLWIASSGEGVGALTLQKMPKADERDAGGWARVQRLAAAVKPSDLWSLDAESLLTSAFPGETVRLFKKHEVKDGCARDEEKVVAMLRSLGRAEVEATLKEHGEVVVYDEICGHEYRFDSRAVERVFVR
jgi:molecular chaperone Hsp33